MSIDQLRRLAVATLVAAGVMLTTAAAPAVASTVPHVLGAATVPVYSYADAVRESVWVQTTMDSDGDRVPDKVAVDVVRPREAAAAQVKVPVIMAASPYYACCGRGNESEKKKYDAKGVISKVPLFYDNYFVPRGYAFVAVDLPGTGRSTGCQDVGGRAEVLGAKAVIDWLGGRATATYADGSPAVAAWTTGKVGMIGKSWDGSVANGVAATRVPGLETIVPISAISSWYDYARFNGVLRQEKYPQFLHQGVTGRPAKVCAAMLRRLNTASADATGDYNAFWAERDFRSTASRVRASVFAVHGINDVNVTTSQVALWWNRLAAYGVHRKIWLSQAAHVDPFDIRRGAWVNTLHRWFDFYLQGLPNGIDREPQATIQTAPGTWVNQPAWPAPGARPVRVSLGNGNGRTGTLGGAPARGKRVWKDNQDLEGDIEVVRPKTQVPGRVVFLSRPLPAAIRISGTPQVSLRVAVNKPTTQLTARLVDYGKAARINYLGAEEGIKTLTTQSCWGASTAADDACYRNTIEDVATGDFAILTRGWQDAAHRVSLRLRTPLVPGRWYTITVPLQPTDQTVRKGHVLGLVLQQSDTDYAVPSRTKATVRLDLAGSRLTLPLVGSAGLPRAGATAPVVSTVLPAASGGRTSRADASPLMP
jgi:X-Pro dipeptidyl-peptidase